MRERRIAFQSGGMKWKNESTEEDRIHGHRPVEHKTNTKLN